MSSLGWGRISNFRNSGLVSEERGHETKQHARDDALAASDDAGDSDETDSKDCRHHHHHHVHRRRRAGDRAFSKLQCVRVCTC